MPRCLVYFGRSTLGAVRSRFETRTPCFSQDKLSKRKAKRTCEFSVFSFRFALFLLLLLVVVAAAAVVDWFCEPLSDRT